MRITYWSDFADPYCYIGRKRMLQAIREIGEEDRIELEMRCFEIDKESPIETTETMVESLMRRFHASQEECEAKVAEIDAMGQGEDSRFSYGKATRTNTMDAHCLVKYAWFIRDEQRFERMERIVDALFEANYIHHENLADREVLLRIAHEVGLAVDDVRHMLETCDNQVDVRDDEAIAKDLEISRVPFFVLDYQQGFSGVGTVEDYKEALQNSLWEREEPHQ